AAGLVRDSSEVGAIVDPEIHPGVRGLVGDDARAGLTQEWEDVAEVVLALSVVLAELREDLGEGRACKGIRARVHLLDRELRRRPWPPGWASRSSRVRRPRGGPWARRSACGCLRPRP